MRSIRTLGFMNRLTFQMVLPQFFPVALSCIHSRQTRGGPAQRKWGSRIIYTTGAIVWHSVTQLCSDCWGTGRPSGGREVAPADTAAAKVTVDYCSWTVSGLEGENENWQRVFADSVNVASEQKVELALKNKQVNQVKGEALRKLRELNGKQR